MKAIRWIFFDIGSTLVDEEEAYKHRIRDMIEDTSVTFNQFWEKRIQFAKEGYNGDQKAIEYKELKILHLAYEVGIDVAVKSIEQALAGTMEIIVTKESILGQEYEKTPIDLFYSGVFSNELR